MKDIWYGKPYYSLDAYCKNSLGHKCYKIALNAHMTCPNRDGTLGARGCIFCSAGGSGDFAVETAQRRFSPPLFGAVTNVTSLTHSIKRCARNRIFKGNIIKKDVISCYKIH